MKVESNENELTEREKEILFELVKGLSNKEIAEVLYISDKTVKIHINKIFKTKCEKSIASSDLCSSKSIGSARLNKKSIKELSCRFILYHKE